MGQYRFLTLEEVTAPTPAGLFQHIVDSWWVTHPEHGLAFFQRTPKAPWHPQCNASEETARALASSINYGWPPVLVFLESAWVPVKKPED